MQLVVDLQIVLIERSVVVRGRYTGQLALELPLLLLELYEFRVLPALLDVLRLLLCGLKKRRDRADRALGYSLESLSEPVRSLPLVDVLLYICERCFVRACLP